MSTLTKIFIVVMVVLTIPASVLFIAQANTTANYKVAWEQQVQRARQYQAQAQTYLTQLEAQKADYARLVEATGMEKAEMQSKVDDMKVQLAALRGENARLKSAQETLNTTVQGLESAVNEQVNMNQVLTGQLEQRLTVVQDQNEQLRELRLSNQQLMRDLENAKEYARVNNQLLNAAEAKIQQLEDKLRRGGVATVAAEAVAPRPTTAIQGRITAVDLNSNVAQLNVGSASGVEEGMVFYLYRNAELVGMLEVAEVEANDSAGILKNLQQDPRQGDMATTDLGVN